MLKPPLRILIVAALCVLALIGIVVRESMARDAGTEVLLAMEAVDPRALLSGNYVVVTLAETLPADQDCLGTPPTETQEDLPREDHWLALRPDGAAHRVAGSAPTREEARRLGPVVVRGTTYCSAAIRAPEGDIIQRATYRSDIGVDRFHINQTDAQRIERLLREQTPGAEPRIYAIVSVGQDGRARLKGLMLDNERLELNWL